MSATPDFPVTGNITPGILAVTANTSMDGSSGTVYIIGTAGTSGAYLYSIQALSAGTNSTDSVCRVFLNNGSATTTAANNILIDEFVLRAVTPNQTTAQFKSVKVMDIRLPANWRIFVTVGNGGSSAGWFVTAIMEDM